MVFTCDLTECLNCGVRAGQQYVEGRKGACFEALGLNSLSSDSNVDSGAPWDTSGYRDVPLITR